MWVWKVRPWSPSGGFFVVFTHGWVVFTPRVFLLEVGWEALVFGHFSQPPFGSLTFPLYSPTWLILSFHLSVRQVLVSIPIPSTVSSYFLLVTKVEAYTIQTSFLVNRIWTWAGAFNAEGTYLPWACHASYFHVSFIPFTSPSKSCLGISFTRTMVFSLKPRGAEDRVILSRSPWHPGHRPFVLGIRHPRHGPRAQTKFGPDCKPPGPTSVYSRFM